jgi:hypothetical protein
MMAKILEVNAGKIYTVEEDSSGDKFVQVGNGHGRCYSGLWEGWSTEDGKPTKIID